MNFSSDAFAGSYTGRKADTAWRDFMAQELPIEDAVVMDVGCGGGIYSRALVELGALRVLGVDSSQVSLRDAESQPHARLTYRLGDATALPAGDASFDIILARALVHHLAQHRFQLFATEALRCLNPQGTLVIQDRTLDDAIARGSLTNPRGYLFELYPHLIEVERERRHSTSMLTETLIEVGFKTVDVIPLIEPRKTYRSLEELLEEIRARRGRTLLHRLTDQRLERFTEFLADRLSEQTPIVELEPWTVYLAR